MLVPEMLATRSLLGAFLRALHCELGSCASSRTRNCGTRVEGRNETHGWNQLSHARFPYPMYCFVTIADNYRVLNSREISLHGMCLGKDPLVARCLSRQKAAQDRKPTHYEGVIWSLMCGHSIELAL